MVSLLGTTPVVICLSLTLNLNRYSYPNPEDHGVEAARNRTVKQTAARIASIGAANKEIAARIAEDAEVAAANEDIAANEEIAAANEEIASNCDDEDDVPIAQQLGILPRLQKSGDGLPLPTHPPT